MFSNPEKPPPGYPFPEEDIKKMFLRAELGGWLSLVKASEALQDERVHEAVAYATAGNQILALAATLMPHKNATKGK